MNHETVKQMVSAVIPDAEVVVEGEGCNLGIAVVSASFEGMSPIKRHRMINDIFKVQLESGDLHALSIKASTPA